MSLTDDFQKILSVPGRDEDKVTAELQTKFIEFQTRNQIRSEAEKATPKDNSLAHAWLDTVQIFVKRDIEPRDWRDLRPAILEFFRTFLASPESNFRKLPEWTDHAAKIGKRIHELAQSGRYNTEGWFESGQ